MSQYSERVRCQSCANGSGPNGCTDCLNTGHDFQAFVGGIEQALNDAYAEGRADEREAIAQLCAEGAADMRKEGEGCRDARYDWMAQGAEALADTLRGINSSTGTPADPVLAAGWRSIETAPKDGTNVILTNGDTVAQGWWADEPGYIREHRDSDGVYLGQDESDGFMGWMDCDGGMQPDPTHWMPLPMRPYAP